MNRIGHALFVGAVICLISGVAAAEGAVRIECWGNCNIVTLGQACDTYQQGSTPVALACDDSGGSVGTSDVSCGNGATCRPFGGMVRSDLLGAYCVDGAGYDAIVTCR
jgi:hypothetical protein